MTGGEPPHVMTGGEPPQDMTARLDCGNLWFAFVRWVQEFCYCLLQQDLKVLLDFFQKIIG
ncbi:MAG: hypothetical protein RR205_01550, partial [Oscillospiraceae bacterium]